MVWTKISKIFDFVIIKGNKNVKNATLCFLMLSWSQLGKKNIQKSDLHLHDNKCKSRQKSDIGFRSFYQNVRICSKMKIKKKIVPFFQ